MNIKPIRNKADYKLPMARIDELWGTRIGSPEGDELEVLAVLLNATKPSTSPCRHPIPSRQSSFAWNSRA